MEGDVSAAVVTGHHEFDVPEFERAFRAMPDVDHYTQSLGNFVADAGDVREVYDAVVFYNFHRPSCAGNTIGEDTVEAIRRLGEAGQGVVVLHHGLLAYPEWDRWSDLCGIADRSFDYHQDRTVDVQITELDHPITAGVEPWTMTDEVYDMAGPSDQDTYASDVLLTVQHPESLDALAWTRTYDNSRVFCFQSGHDARVFSDHRFREVLRRGIHWSAENHRSDEYTPIRNRS